VRYREPRGSGATHTVELLAALGPDVVSGDGATGVAYTRAYFQCLTSDGTLVLLFRDLRRGADTAGRRGGWYLHGWWD
jgi:hypothetical protein